MFNTIQKIIQSDAYQRNATSQDNQASIILVYYVVLVYNKLNPSNQRSSCQFQQK